MTDTEPPDVWMFVERWVQANAALLSLLAAVLAAVLGGLAIAGHVPLWIALPGMWTLGGSEGRLAGRLKAGHHDLSRSSAAQP